jgi:uncharacterized membrane protein YeaQ/YmgE (transglycosylase-associated protein family)
MSVWFVTCQREEFNVGLIAWIIIGAVAGWLASIAVGRNRSMGFFANLVVGVLGGLLGGFIMNLLGNVGLMGFSIRSLLVAFGGAVVLLLITNWFSRRR